MTQTAQQRRGSAKARPAGGHFASLGRFIAQHEQRARADDSALAELSASPQSALDMPAGLEIEWLGVAGYRLTYEGQTIYLDPYVSRVLVQDVSARPAGAGRCGGASRAGSRRSGRCVGVLVGHTHFDHAVDVPALCARHGCKAYGSSSLLQLMRLYGRGEQAVQVAPHEAFELGPFTVTFVPSVHSKLLLGYRVPSDGELTCEHLDALSPGAYRCGQVWGIHIEVAGFSFYHQGSANLHRRGDPPHAAWTCSSQASPGGASPTATGRASSARCSRAWWWRATSTTSSARSSSPRASR